MMIYKEAYPFTAGLTYFRANLLRDAFEWPLKFYDNCPTVYFGSFRVKIWDFWDVIKKLFLIFNVTFPTGRALAECGHVRSVQKGFCFCECVSLIHLKLPSFVQIRQNFLSACIISSWKGSIIDSGKLTENSERGSASESALVWNIECRYLWLNFLFYLRHANVYFNLKP